LRRINATKSGVRLDACNKEGLSLMHHIKTGEIQMLDP
jgi:hypothetical protein